MTNHTIVARIKEICGPDGPKNYRELKKYLQDKDFDEVMKEFGISADYYGKK